MFNTVLKGFLFVPGVDDEVSSTEPKYSAAALKDKPQSFYLNISHAAATPTTTEIKTAFETFFGATDLVYKSFIAGSFIGEIRTGYPSTEAAGATTTGFNCRMSSDGTTVTHAGSRFVSYGNSEIDTNLFISVYPEDTTNYNLMLKKVNGQNSKIAYNGSSVVADSAIVNTPKSFVFTGVSNSYNIRS